MTTLVRRQFEPYITQHRYNDKPIRFLHSVQSVFLQKRRLVMDDLYEPPLTTFSTDAVDRWSSVPEMNEMLAFVNRLTI